jgi:hypothetical protein
MIAGTSNSMLPEILGKLFRRLFDKADTTTALSPCPHCGRSDEPLPAQQHTYSPRRSARMEIPTAANRANRDHTISVVPVEETDLDSVNDNNSRTRQTRQA